MTTVSVHERNDTPLAVAETTQYGYDAIGNLDWMRQPGDILTDYRYDSLNRLEKLEEFISTNTNKFHDSGEALLSSYDYTLLPNGRRKKVVETDDSGSVEIDWVYDNLGRLTEERYNSFDDSLDFIDRYTHDLVGNRLKKETDTNPTFSGDPTFEEAIDYYYDANDRLYLEKFDSGIDGIIETSTTYYFDFAYPSPSNYRFTTQKGKTVWEGENTDLSNGGKRISYINYEYDFQDRLSRVTNVEGGDDGYVGYINGGVFDDELTRTLYTYNDNGDRIEQAITENYGGPDLTDDVTTTTEYLVDSNNPTGYAQVWKSTKTSTQTAKSNRPKSSPPTPTATTSWPKPMPPPRSCNYSTMATAPPACWSTPPARSSSTTPAHHPTRPTTSPNVFPSTRSGTRMALIRRWR